MKQFVTVVALVAISILYYTTTYAQSTEQPDAAFPKDQPAKFQRVEPSPSPNTRVNAAWRTRPSGSDHPEILRLIQDFELATYPPTGWTLTYTGTLYWTRSTAASGYGIGIASSKFDFWTAGAGITQTLTTSTFAATVPGDSLVFDYAHAFYNDTSIDSLTIETSTDGGATWTSLVRLYSDTAHVSLSTVSSTSLFTPTAAQWGTKRYTIPVGTNQIRFTAISGFGNNLYLDNIKVGVQDPNDIAAAAFISPLSGGAVPPNSTFTPSSSFQNAGTATQTNVSVKYEIRNSVPAIVYTSTKVIASIAPGVTTTVPFDPVTGGIAAGNYTIRSVVVTPDANSANDTLNGTLRAVGPLTGTKTIGGTSPDFPTFTAAVADLVLGGVGSGGVIFNVRPGTYPERFTVGPVPGSSATNTVLFKREGGQVTVNGTGTAATNDPMILLLGCDYVTFDSIDVSDGGTSTTDQVEYGYLFNSSAGTDGANNNTIKNARIMLGGSGTAPGFSHGVLINSLATRPSGTCNNNKIQNLSIDRSDRGVAIFGIFDGSTNILYGDDNNEISGCVLGQSIPLGDSLTGAGGSPIGIIVSANTNARVFNNWVYSIQSLHPTSTAGIIALSCQVTTGDFYNNRVLNIRHFGTASTALIGGVQTGAPINGVARIYNNFISNVTRVYTGAATATLTAYGIRPTNFTAGGNGINRLFYNTIYLKDSVTGGVAYSSAGVLLFASNLPVEVRNNVLVNNTSTSSATAKSYAIVDANATRGALTSDNNDLYAGGTNGYIGLLGAATFQLTLANWQAGSGQDLRSVTESPAFRNIATVPNDLHIDSTAATRLESGGSNVTGVTTDIDGQTRVVATLTPNVAPDIGADEFSGTPTDNVGPAITYSSLSGTSSTGNRTLPATIKDLVSGVDVRAGLNPRLYYKKNGGSSWSSPQVDSAGVRVGDVWTFTINTTSLGGVVVGDTVYYYVAAADSAGNVSTNPFGGSGLTPPGNVAPTTTNFYRVLPGISGTMTIGATAATFTTVKAAFDSINASVLTGAITLLINADYAGDGTFPISLNQPVYQGAGPFAITLKPNTGVTTVISGSSTTSVIKLNGADNVIIDGSNSGGTTRNLTVSNTSTAAGTAAIWLSSLGSGAGCINNTIKNCFLSSGARQDSFATITFGIITSGTTIGTAVDGFDNDNNTFSNNAVTKARYGIYLRGAVANTNDNNLINQNLVGPTAFGVDAIGLVGIVIQNQNAATLTQNEIRFVGGPFALTLGGGADRVGIGVGSSVWPVTNTNVTNSTITRNLIHDLVEERTFSAVGIVHGSNANPSSNTIANNMIYKFRANATPGDQAVGIAISAGTGDKIVYNSILMTGPIDTVTGVATATRSNAGIVIGTTAVTNLILKNNIVYADVISRTTTLKHYAIIAPSIAFAWGSGGSDNNDFYINTSNPQMALGGIGTANPYTDAVDLAAWRTRFTPSQDANSISANPIFADLVGANLHILPTAASPVDSAATPIAGVTVDYDGQTRNATRPDIGADEYTRSAAPPIGILSIVRNTRVPNAGDSLVVTARIIDSSSVGITSDSLLFSLNGGPPVAVSMPRISGSNTDGTYRGVIPGGANTNGTRVEYQIRATGAGGGTVTTSIVAANSYFAGVSPLTLTGFRSMGGNRQVLYANYYVRTTGTVNSPNFTALSGRISYMFQDAVGGTNVNRAATSLVLNIGDSIVVLGLIGQFRGTTQLTPDSLTDISVASTGRPLVATDVTVNAYNANPEQYESRLIRMASLQRLRATPPWGNNAAIPVYQGVIADSTLLFLDADTPVPGMPEPAYPVTVTGVAGQFTTSAPVFNDGYEIIPRSAADFAPPGAHDIGVLSLGAGPSPEGPFVTGISREMPPTTAKQKEPESTLPSSDPEGSKDGVEARSKEEPILDNHLIGGQSISITPLLGASTDLPGGDAPLNFRALVRNYGAFIEPTYQVGWTIDGVQQTAVNQPRPLQISATDTVILTWASPIAGAHVARAFTILASDANHSNDTSAPYNFNVLPAGVVFQEGFNATIPPYPAGWHVKNRDGGGSTTYFQGNPAVFPPFEGSGYIGANYQAANGFYIDEWLVTPNTGGLADVTVVDSLIFWQRAPGLPAFYPDSIQIRVSTTDTAVASFTTVLDYFRVDTSFWRRKAYALPNGANRFIAFRYLIYDGGPSGNNSNYIGIDGVQIKRSHVAAAGWVTQTSGAATALNSTKAIDAATGWIGGNGARMLRTTDAGDTWTNVGGGAIGAADIYAIDAVDANTAFATTSPGGTFIYRTTNAGTTWTQVYTDPAAAAFIDAIKMFDAANGIAMGDPVGGRWVILRTSNGGASWVRDTVNAPLQVGTEAGSNNGLAAVGSTNIWFCSNTTPSKIYRTTNSGTSWSGVNLPFTASFTAGIAFNSALYGVVGANGGQAARTTDGGVTWISVTVPGAGGIFAVTGSGLDFFVTRGTNVYRSTDRGATWAISYTGAIGGFNHISFATTGPNTRGWAVTATGGIAAFYGIVTGVEENKPKEVPLTFAMMQNYPNPFNPITTLRYALPKDARVTLTLYNVLGQRVITLRDEVQSVGFYDVVWDGRNDFGSAVSSGVYFYRIEAKPVDGSGAFSSIKKMLMLK